VGTGAALHASIPARPILRMDALVFMDDSMAAGMGAVSCI
jgi:hypothetical protein